MIDTRSWTTQTEAELHTQYYYLFIIQPVNHDARKSTKLFPKKSARKCNCWKCWRWILNKSVEYGRTDCIYGWGVCQVDFLQLHLTSGIYILFKTSITFLENLRIILIKYFFKLNDAFFIPGNFVKQSNNWKSGICNTRNLSTSFYNISQQLCVLLGNVTTNIKVFILLVLSKNANFFKDLSALWRVPIFKITPNFKRLPPPSLLLLR